MWRLWMLVIVLLAAACGGPGDSDGAAGSGPGAGTVVVIRVVDGDSLTVETETGPLEVRLSGVNSPERGECHHHGARAHLETILEGARVTMVREGSDQFGRALARVVADGSDVALELVRGGHGIAVATAPHHEDLVAAEEAAYLKRLGMWGPHCGSGPPPPVGFDPPASVADPAGPDQEHLDAELISVVNLGGRPVDLSGWALRDGSSRHRFTFDAGTVLGPGERLEVASSSPGWAPGGEPVWSNPSDVAILLDDVGRVVARWRY